MYSADCLVSLQLQLKLIAVKTGGATDATIEIKGIRLLSSAGDFNARKKCTEKAHTFLKICSLHEHSLRMVLRQIAHTTSVNSHAIASC